MKNSVTKNAAVIFVMSIVVFVTMTQTGRAASITSTSAAGGNWNASGTWNGGVIPSAGDDVTIVSGSTVTIINATPITINNLTVNGALYFGSAAVYSFTVTGSIVVAGASSVFSVNTSAPARQHSLTVNGDFDASNAVQVNFYGGSSNWGVNVTFAGASNSTVSGKISFAKLTINKTSGAYVSCSTPGSGTNSTKVKNTFTFTSGIWKVTSGVFELVTHTISGAGASQYFSTEGTGTFQIDAVSTSIGFPIGNGDYTPITITPSAQSDFNVSVQNSFDNANLPVSNKVVNKQWNITGSVDIDLVLQWNSNATNNDEVGAYNGFSHANSNDIYIGWWTGSQWQENNASFVDHGGGIYTAELSGMSVYSKVGVSNAGGLPVELTSFEAYSMNDAVHLSWRTATEINNAGFYVERSTPETPDTWTTLSFLPGSGVSNTPKTYAFNDDVNALRQSDASQVQYRLRQVDRDGSYTYSNVLQVTIPPVQSTLALDQNYPNPFNPSTTISFTLRTPQVITLIVYNDMGREMARICDNVFIPAGRHSVTFHAGSFPSGIYAYRLIGSKEVLHKSMMLAK